MPCACPVRALCVPCACLVRTAGELMGLVFDNGTFHQQINTQYFAYRDKEVRTTSGVLRVPPRAWGLLPASV